ncbi:J domain-containing protein [Pseudomonas capsici]|uniref:J domain-containing protein n=1 Tax=Pseudomonas capsici TaxID=2810614 RepID=UPI0021F222B4|nr:J domain-containing protein [Pseudomonas capsici]MCV4286232.1 J domain-containing protein [Pseudomonas capsici]
MSDCWAVLALPDDADERSIKRQYARLLKSNRPDEDAEAFQRLRDAYEQALHIARYRNESDDDEVAELSVPARHDASPSWLALVDQATVDNLHELSLQARTMGCMQGFEQGLLQRCLADPEREIELTQAATPQLNWLTPWQEVPMNGEQSARLTQILLDAHQTQLQARLQAGEEGAFIDALQTLRQQPWLASLERSEHLQRWVMILLHNTAGWSATLFEQVCDLFGWDVKKALHPEPAFIWQRLLDRIEKDDFVRHLQRLLGKKPFSAEGRAVHLLLGAYSPVERRRIARAEDDNVRLICKRLVEQMTQRYPGILEVFPDADLESWKLAHEPFSPEARRCLVIAALPVVLLFGLSLYFQRDQDLWFLILYPLLMVPGLMVYMYVWRPLCEVVATLDEWLSIRLLPDVISGPTANAKVVQHALPLIVVGGVMAWKSGGLGLALHCFVTLIWIAFAPYRYPRPYAALKRFFRARKMMLGRVFLGAFCCMLAAGFFAMSQPGGTRERAAASQGGYQSDCNPDNLRRTMSLACQTALDSTECAQSEWAKRMHACGVVAEMVRKTMEAKVGK